MKYTAILSALAMGSSAAFAPVTSSSKKSSTSSLAFSAEDMPGVLSPTGFFDPLGFSKKADEAIMKRYREAEITHGRVAMLASIGFLTGEYVEGSTFLFDSQIRGPAITHLSQIPTDYLYFVVILVSLIGGAEFYRATNFWVSPDDSNVSRPGELNADYQPGNLNFDPFSLKPEDPDEFFEMQTRELQNGRVAMLAAAGFIAQELTNGKGILENLGY
mmetsp:Transcript_33131/g.38366  ORF Transcript_33131/g.38366 Transcript_33131/m.38366 type:complete len:217 (-) Transcript_33131:127-777(-)